MSKHWETYHTTGAMFLVAAVVAIAAIITVIKSDQRQEREMADKGLCWQATPGGRGYAKCWAPVRSDEPEARR